jgi:hypothetical protein
MVFRQEAPAAQQQSFSRVPTPPLLSAGQQSGGYGSHSGVPEPPAPRCWAPSKLSNGSAGASKGRANTGLRWPSSAARA